MMKKLFFITVIFLFTAMATAGNIQREWVKRFNSNSAVTAAQLDANGNLYIGGYDYIVKYNSAGDRMWTTQRQGNIAKLFLQNNQIFSVYMGGNGSYSLENYNAQNGQRDWSVDYSTSRGWNEPVAAAQDDSGNIYVVGFSGQRGEYDYVIMKFNSARELLWQQVYDSGFSEQPTDVVVSQTGIYVVGTAFGNNQAHYLIVKYNFDGQFKWATTYVGENQNWAEAVKSSVDKNGNLYVTGYAGDFSSGMLKADFHTVKYNADGKQIWVATYDGPYKGTEWDMDTPSGILINSAGVFVIGGVASSSKYDWVIIKYDFNGKQKWVKAYPNNYPAFPNAMTADKDGDIYVTGVVKRPKSGYYDNTNFLSIKYDASNGNQLWTAVYDAPGNSRDRGNAIFVDDAYVYVVGTSSYFTNTYFTAIKYTQSITSVDPMSITVTDFCLNQNYPNPFNPVTTIKYELPQSVQVELTIYNISGQKVATLVSQKQAVGEYKVQFNASNLPSGTYIYQLRAGKYVETKKMILLK